MLLIQLNEIFQPNPEVSNQILYDVLAVMIIFLSYCIVMAAPLVLNMFTCSDYTKERLLKRYYVRVGLLVIPFIGVWVSLFMLASDLKAIHWKIPFKKHL